MEESAALINVYPKGGDFAAPNLRNWASELDAKALDQAARTARLPILAGPVALMADAHWGMGATVGSVIATDGAIIPSAVGVDIGPVDMDTEFLSPFGWIKISQYAGERILSFDLLTGQAFFEQPLAYTLQDIDEFYHLHSAKGLDQMLGAHHKVVFYHGFKGRGYTPEISLAAQLVHKHESLSKGLQGGFKTTFDILNNPLFISDDQIRLQVMIAADGTLRERNRVPNVVELHFRKENKIARCEMLLKSCDIDYKKYEHQDGTVSISFVPTMWTKDLTFLYLASRYQLKIAAEESLLWDGHAGYRSYYCSTNKSNADVIQFAFAATGTRAGIYNRDDNRNPDWATMYSVIPTRNEMVGIPPGPVEKIPSVDGKAYCFTTTTGFWVMRRNNNIAITGNCGMIASQTDLTAEDLPELDKFMKQVRKAVPAGVGNGHERSTEYANKWFRRNPMPDYFEKEQRTRALKQFGSLGSGNHFAEISLDDSGVVWIVLHSGSRGIGNELARIHIKKAGKHFEKIVEGDYQLEDKDLAWFIQDTEDFQLYMSDLMWAQNYALGNREAMMSALLVEFFTYVGKGKTLQTINCHHNYTAIENHDGRDIYITRKGAIKAYEGDLGIIPGSMGTDTFIVRGLGNPLSYCSCSHGAGRRLSRGAAKKQLTTDSLAEKMEGRVWLKNEAEHLLDEHPDAYKSIDDVMVDQADLIEPIHRLTAILNFKG